MGWPIKNKAFPRDGAASGRRLREDSPPIKAQARFIPHLRVIKGGTQRHVFFSFPLSCVVNLLSHACCHFLVACAIFSFCVPFHVYTLKNQNRAYLPSRSHTHDAFAWVLWCPTVNKISRSIHLMMRRLKRPHATPAGHRSSSGLS